MIMLALVATLGGLPFQITPGEVLGHIALGQTEASLKTLGMPVEPGAIPSERLVGPYTVQLEEGKVVRVTLALGGGATPVKVGDKTAVALDPLGLAALIGGCGPLEPRIGGNIIECVGGARISQHRGGFDVSVVPAGLSPKTECAGYVTPGAPHSKVVIEPGRDYCVPSRVVNDGTAQADILGALRYDTCRTTPNEGATLITCPHHGVRFVFAAPSGRLARVEGVPFAKTE